MDKSNLSADSVPATDEVTIDGRIVGGHRKAYFLSTVYSFCLAAHVPSGHTSSRLIISAMMSSHRPRQSFCCRTSSTSSPAWLSAR